jgi:hypothetical protein
MNQFDDGLSDEEDVDDVTRVLDPSLLPSETVSDARKRKDGKQTSVGTPGEKAWRERDSILRVKAYVWVEDSKHGTTFSSLKLCFNERLGIAANSRRQHVQTLLRPDETGRSSTSVIARLKDMLSMFKYFPDRTNRCSS